jgi:hypothetical protein
MTDKWGDGPTMQSDARVAALRNLDARDITLASKGRTPYFILGITRPLVLEGRVGVDNFCMVRLPSETASLSKPVAEALDRIQGGVDNVQTTNPVDATRFGEQLPDMSQYQVWGRNEDRTVDYLQILIKVLCEFGDAVIEGASHEEALTRTQEFLAGLH